MCVRFFPLSKYSHHYHHHHLWMDLLSSISSISCAAQSIYAHFDSVLKNQKRIHEKEEENNNNRPASQPTSEEVLRFFYTWFELMLNQNLFDGLRVLSSVHRHTVHAYSYYVSKRGTSTILTATTKCLRTFNDILLLLHFPAFLSSAWMFILLASIFLLFFNPSIISFTALHHSDAMRCNKR